MKQTSKAFLIIVIGSMCAMGAHSQNNDSQPKSTDAQKATSQESSGQNKIAFDQLPKRVQRSVHKQMHDSQVSEVNQANLNGEIVYNVTLDNHGKLSRYTFNENGKVLSQPGQPISEAAGAQPNHSKQPETDEQHNHNILQHPK